MAKDIKEVEDSPIGLVSYKGKSLSDWQKAFKGEFTAQQILRLIAGGMDIEKLQYGAVSEAGKESIDDKALFKDEEFFFEKKDNIDETVRQPEDVVTVGDFIELLRRNAKLDDKIVFRTMDKKECMLFDVESKAGVALVDIVAKKNAENVDESGLCNEDIELAADSPIEDFMTVADLKRLAEKSYPHNSTAWLTDNIACIINGKIVDFSKVKYVRAEGYPTNGTFFLMDGTDASLAAYEKEKEVMLSEKDIDEGRSWQRGGYGGTGQSYSRLGSKAPRGADIGWYAVKDIEPKAAGKMPGWRCGPSNFPFEDLLYPNRKYKVGTFIMRNKYVKAGEMSGEINIALPSYFAAIQSNDEKAIELLKALGIPLDLTFGMDPKDDYSMTYTMNETSMSME